MYSNTHFLNTEILTDLPDVFSSFFIDLRDVKTETKLEKDKAETIKLFENFLKKIPDSESKLRQNIPLTTNAQYQKGL